MDVSTTQVYQTAQKKSRKIAPQKQPLDIAAKDTQITTVAGDVILYSGNRIVLFYGSNSRSYTRLGKIEGYSPSELAALLGAGSGDVEVTLSLN